MKIKSLRFAASLALASLPLAPAVVYAHHSFAMFDQKQEVELTGVVKEFQWTNPHVWVEIMVEGKDGKTVQWSIEAASPNSLRRQGWKRESFTPGDHVTVKINPMRDGSPGGAFLSAILADGSKLGN